MYITKNPDGSIRWSSNTLAGLKLQDPDFEPEWTDEDIVNTDGGLYLASQRPAPSAPTPEELAEARRGEIKAALAALDDKYLPPRVLAGLALGGDAYAEEQWAKHEAEAAPLRAELAGLAAAEGGPVEAEVEA